MHVFLDGIDVFNLFLAWIGVVKTQIALAAEFRGKTKIEAYRLGMADMQIAVRFRWKARCTLP